MKCPNCESSNIQSHIIVEDKVARNAQVVFIVTLVAIVLALVVYKYNPLLIWHYGVYAIALMVVLNIVLLLFPATTKTIFVCHECGEEFKKDQSK